MIIGEGVGDGEGEGDLICNGKGDCPFVDDDDDCVGDDKTGGVEIEDEEDDDGVVDDDKDGDGVLICKGDNDRSSSFDEELCCENALELNREVWFAWLEDWGGFRIESASDRIESIPWWFDKSWLWR